MAPGGEQAAGEDRWRWQRRLRATGSEPDARFTLANERTFLAWTRTSLGFMAAGVGLRAFASPDLPVPLVRAVSSLLVLVGLWLTWSSWRRWHRVEAALRQDRPLPFPTALPVLPVLVAVVAIAVLVLPQWP